MSEEERMLSFDDAYRRYLARVRHRLLPYVY
jgi:protein-S-isoprenylcysteine O-methyltransferase Ste14